VDEIEAFVLEPGDKVCQVEHSENGFLFLIQKANGEAVFRIAIKERNNSYKLGCKISFKYLNPEYPESIKTISANYSEEIL
jgi:hypothetical protein